MENKIITFEDIQKANESIITTDIKGKDYAEVNQRIKAFRMVYPTGYIITNMEKNENGICVFKAQVGYYKEHNTIADDEKGKKYQDTYNEKIVLATGTAYEKENSTFINKTSYIENCETSAVGRALGMCGFGINTSVASAEEVLNAINNQVLTKEEALELEIKFGQYKGNKLKDIVDDERYLRWLFNNSKDENMVKAVSSITGWEIKTDEELQEELNIMVKYKQLLSETNTLPNEVPEYYQKQGIEKMTIKEYKDAIQILEKKKEKMKNE